MAFLTVFLVGYFLFVMRCCFVCLVAPCCCGACMSAWSSDQCLLCSSCLLDVLEYVEIVICGELCADMFGEKCIGVA